MEILSPLEKTKQIKKIAAPGGCVLCEGLKGRDAGTAARALRDSVNVRGTFTTSAGRPRRRSRGGTAARMETAPNKAKGPPVRVALLLCAHRAYAMRSSSEINDNPAIVVAVH